MKPYIKSIITVLLTVLSTITFAQNSELKKQEINFGVAGRCNDCKDRIEKALDIKGIKFAEWNKEEQLCKVVYNPQKISENDIHNAIAKIGHDTDKVKATDEDYENLQDCCHYNRVGKESHIH